MTLPLIKLVLLAAIVVIGVLAYRGSRRASYRLLWRSAGVLVAVGAGLSVLFPNSLTEVANLVGVGRGTDLVLYVLVVTFMLVTVTLVRRLSELERRYVRLARWVAIHDARRPERPEAVGPVAAGDEEHRE